MVPRTIHYCWFGGTPLTTLAIKCIDSWKRFCPEYEIKEWNEDNFPIDSCIYVKEAYEAKKWAFVSDYARFWILYREGGLYFDTDVELIKPIGDIVEHGPFMACEILLADQHSSLIRFVVNPGLGLATDPGSDLYREILDSYIGDYFINKDGTENHRTIVTRTTDVLKKYGYDQERNKIQFIKESYIYPSEYFSPICYATGEMRITDNTRSIHHYSESWKTKEEKQMKVIRRWIDKHIGNSFGRVLFWISIIPLRIKMKLKKFGLIGTVKLVVGRYMDRRS